MDIVIQFASVLCLFLGSFLCIAGGVGVMRFPDFYTRMHAVGVSDTLAAAFILIGLLLQDPDAIVAIKLILILLMTLFINPTASHALAKAAMQNGLAPLGKNLASSSDTKENSEEAASSTN